MSTNNDTQLAALKKIKHLIKTKKNQAAFYELQLIANVSDPFHIQLQYKYLLDTLHLDQLNLIPIKIAIISTSTISHFSDIFRLWMAIIGFNAILYLVEVNAMEQSILNHTGKLYTFHPDIIWIFSNYRDLKINATHNCDKTSIRQAISNHVQHFKSLWNNIQAHSSAYIIQNNAELPLERVFGNFESTIHWGQINYIRNFNNQLAEAVMPDVSLLDIDYISSLFGKHQWFDEKFWYHSKHAFSFDAVGLVAFHGARLIAGIKGHAKKCLVLDLDNVLWGGNIGDEGLSGIRLGYGSDGEAFTDFQKYIKQLKDRGIILTVCSKNEEEIAKLPFEHHPNMVLKLDDITMFMANWKNKADNIREISNFLNIDLKSMVFIDDNPSERQLVRNTLETIAIPEISNDPASYIRTLDAQRYFELNYLSEEDKLRTKMYRAYKTHQNLKHSLGSISQYLQTLQMEAIAKNLDEFHLPRAAQLINKSNQFNLTTIRYTERQLKNMMKNKNIICRYYKLKDCCCDNGLIAIVILKKQKNHKLHIDSWVMSCRILGRNMENFVYNDIISIAKKNNFQILIGRYKPTTKNKLVANLYKQLNFIKIEEKKVETFWHLNIKDGIMLDEVFIKQVELY